MGEFDGGGAGVNEGFNVGRVLGLEEGLADGSVDGCGLELDEGLEDSFDDGCVLRFDEGFSATGGAMQVPTNFQTLDALAVPGPGPDYPSPGNGAWLAGGMLQ